MEKYRRKWMACFYKRDHHALQYITKKMRSEKMADASFLNKSTELSVSWNMAITSFRAMSQQEKKLLRESWPDDYNDLHDLGADIFERLFVLKPELQSLFPFPTSTSPTSSHGPTPSMRNSFMFRQHALKFIQVITRCVNSLVIGGQVEVAILNKHIRQVGVRHRKFSYRGFMPEFWDSFVTALTEVMNERIEKNQDYTEVEKEFAYQIWEELANYLIAELKLGFGNPELLQSDS